LRRVADLKSKAGRLNSKIKKKLRMLNSGQPPIAPQESVTSSLASQVANTTLGPLASHGMTNEEAEKILLDAELRAQGQTTATAATATGPPAQTVTIDAATFTQMQQMMQFQQQQMQQMMQQRQFQPNIMPPPPPPPENEEVKEVKEEKPVARCKHNPEWCTRKLTLSNGTSHSGRCSAKSKDEDAEMAGVLSAGGPTSSEQAKRVNKLKRKPVEELAKDLETTQQQADDIKLAIKYAKQDKRNALKKEQEKIAADAAAAEERIQAELRALGSSSQDW